MTLDERHESTLALVHAYGRVHPEEHDRLARVIAHLAEPRDGFTRSNRDGHMTSSALVLNQPRTHVLLIHHRFLGLWLQPGGHYEPPGSLWDSARREVAEETGVTDLVLCAPFDATGLPIDIDSHLIPDRPAKSETPHWHHDLCFLAATTHSGPLTSQADEIHDARWLPIGDLVGMSNARMARLGRKLERSADRMRR
ncbi:NUDIX hydrolase [soil metagenome]